MFRIQFDGNRGSMTFRRVTPPNQLLADGPRSGNWGKWVAYLLLSAACLPMSPSWAGLSASDVVVVVNGASFNSRTLANHYVRMRNIPSLNVVVLSQVPSSEVITVEQFRSQILRPLLTEIERRNLHRHVRCITYSADFPTAIDISTDLNPLGNLPKEITPKASISGATYLYRQMLADGAGYVNLGINFYCRRKLEDFFRNPAGSLSKPSWDLAQKHIANGEHADAAELLKELHAKYPYQFPIAYMAAAEFALCDQTDEAIELLGKAVEGCPECFEPLKPPAGLSGWSAGGFLAQDSRFDSLRDNADFQILELALNPDQDSWQDSVGFNSATNWAPNGIAVPDANLGMRYLLCTVLGVTRGGGTSVTEAVAALSRASEADSTHPDGKFFYCLTSDVRTTTRRTGYPDAINALQSMGFQAELIRKELPENEPRVLGVQFGTPTFDWQKTQSEFVAGAIADNLTSHGAVMTSKRGQTKLTELLKAGVAGSSGTVIEPYSIQAKFPLPQMYVHYARGATLAEAFYLSVAGPYQLLVVGDPLCKPFSNAPNYKIGHDLRQLEMGENLKVKLENEGISYLNWVLEDQPKAEFKGSFSGDAISILVDGVQFMSDELRKLKSVPNEVNFPPTNHSLGFHELTLQFTSNDPLEQRSESVVPIWIGPRDAITLELEGIEIATANESARTDRPLLAGSISLKESKLLAHVSAADAQQLSIWHDRELLASAEGDSAEFRVQLSSLGMGPVRLQARAETRSGELIYSEPVWINIQP